MKAPACHVVIMVCSLCILASCTKINLQGNKGGTANPSGSASTSTTGGNSGGTQPSANNPPALDGEWEVDYEFKGDPRVGTVTFSQQGNVIAGQGADQDGREWSVENGEVQGTKIAFAKKYAGSNNAINYAGELKYIQSPEYTGWIMEGTYEAPGPGGQPVTGKWVSNPTAAQQAADAAAAPPPQDQPPPQQQNFPPPVQNAAPANIGDAKPADISGHYDVGYSYDFKKINSKMWLRNDADKVSGDGVDTTTGEKFTIAKGWYKYPSVTLIRQYPKSKGKEARSIMFKAKISSDGKNIVMKGETQYGGQWDAHLVR